MRSSSPSADQPGKAACAASIADSISAAVPAGAWAKISPLLQSVTGSVPPAHSTHAPLMKCAVFSVGTSAKAERQRREAPPRFSPVRVRRRPSISRLKHRAVWVGVGFDWVGIFVGFATASRVARYNDFFGS